MRVIFDDQIFSSQTRGGISNYFINIVEEFENTPELDVEVLGFPMFTKNQHLLEAGKGSRIPYSALNRRPILRLLNWTRRALRKLSTVSHAQVVHRTYYLDRSWSRNQKVRNVVTVHDMTPELFPEEFPNGNPHAHKAANIYAADAIACVSETTKGDLLRMYPDLHVPVIVTPLGVSPRFTVSRKQETGHGGYFVYVGARTGYKNFELLLRALPLLDSKVVWNLVLIGGGPITGEEMREFAKQGVAERISQFQPTDAELVDVYREAICLVFPSKYEGFGLPTLEAMASGCPTLLSETPALMEVGGTASIYFPLGDPEFLAAKMTDLARNDSLRQELRRRGLERAALYSWARTASLTEACYRAALAR